MSASTARPGCRRQMARIPENRGHHPQFLHQAQCRPPGHRSALERPIGEMQPQSRNRDQRRKIQPLPCHWQIPRWRWPVCRDRVIRSVPLQESSLQHPQPPLDPQQLRRPRHPEPRWNGGRALPDVRYPPGSRVQNSARWFLLQHLPSWEILRPRQCDFHQQRCQSIGDLVPSQPVPLTLTRCAPH